jgi:CRP-like cAMP-binding protein
MEQTMYDNLLQLPLFQGLSKGDLTTIIEKVKLHFLTYKKGQKIATQGESCQQLTFLLGGEITISTTDEEHGYILSENIHAPYIIEPYSLFGMHPNFSATYYTKSEAQILTIDKSYILGELDNYQIFKLNYLNLLSNRCQILQQKIWDGHTNGIVEKKFFNFLQLRCQKPYGEKTLKITMEDLASLIDETRINVSRLLNEWQKQELLQLKRKEIYIPALENIAEQIKNNHQD